MSRSPIRWQQARQAGLALCTDCHYLSRMPPLHSGQTARCPRCGKAVWLRHPATLTRTWALLCTATLLLLPANLLPIMTLTSLGTELPDTILSGVLRLARNDLWGIALIVFTASILVPILKLAGLLVLQLSIQRGWRLSPAQCTVMYRFIQLVGRWSMLDLFVIAILVAVVDIGNLAHVSSGPAAGAFAAVVVITMFAANTFDSRLLWDLVDESE